ncbi:MAG: hypothetical protein WC752_00020 [Patescibacteria group bacterium]|jgi:hypothetical protein
MGSTWKNILLSLAVCGFPIAISFAFADMVATLSSLPLKLLLSLVSRFIQLLETGLFIYILIKTVTALIKLKEGYPQEKFNVALEIILLVLFYIFALPPCLSLRDKILKKYNKFTPIISYNFYTVIVSIFLLSMLAGGMSFYYRLYMEKTHPDNIKQTSTEIIDRE